MSMNNTSPTARNESGFKLVEACAVIVVLTLLVMIFVGVSSPRDGGGSKRPQDMSNLRHIGIAMAVYAIDHDDWLPLHPRSAMLHLDGVPSISRDFWLNPYQEINAAIDRGDFEGAATRFGGYVFINLGENINEIKKPSKTIFAYTAKVSEKQTTRGVLFVDGHAESWEEEKLRAALPPGIDVDALDGP